VSFEDITVVSMEEISIEFCCGMYLKEGCPMEEQGDGNFIFR
jgi:hypothetical protein